MLSEVETLNLKRPDVNDVLSAMMRFINVIGKIMKITEDC